MQATADSDDLAAQENASIQEKIDEIKSSQKKVSLMNERVYADYCNLYDGLFLPAFRTTQPQTEEALYEFLKVYLDLKSPQWYLGEHGPCYRGPSITISDETVPIVRNMSRSRTRGSKSSRRKRIFLISLGPIPTFQ